MPVSTPLRPLNNPKDKSSGSLFVCLKISNVEDCAKLALSNLIIDCGEAIDRSEHRVENINAMIEDAEIVMKSNLPKLFQDAVPALDAFSNAIERIIDVCMIHITTYHLIMILFFWTHPYLKLAWGITTTIYDVRLSIPISKGYD